MRRARELSLSHYCRGQQTLNSRPGDGRPNLDNWSNHAPIQRSKSLLTTRAPPATPQTRRPAQKSQQPELAVPAPPSRVWKPRLSNFLELGSSPDFTNVKSTGAWAKKPAGGRRAGGKWTQKCKLSHAAIIAVSLPLQNISPTPDRRDQHWLRASLTFLRSSSRSRMNLKRRNDE